ncbi:MAG TPA: hypothetical protein VGX24_06105 [Pyrinomonadaceae bacterium]|jgi:hypothetical protein|nr:hypothetical protein [Pyrinomonadaceae bacterium]
MKRILTLTLFLILTMALIPVNSIIGNSQTGAAGSQSQRRVSVRAIVSPRAPVGIDNATATITDNQAVLQYALDNRTGRQSVSVELLAFTLDEGGRVKGGEGWTVANDTTESHPENFLRILKTKPEDVDRLTLTVWRAGGFEANEAELNNILRPRAARGEQFATGRLVKVALAAGEYCLDRLAVAEKSCSCGVKSYSCNPTSGEWSFTCYSKAEAPAQCKQTESESE